MPRNYNILYIYQYMYILDTDDVWSFFYFRHSHPTPREHLQLSAIPEGHCKYSQTQRILIMIEQEVKAWAYTEIYRLQPCQTPEFIGEYISFSAF